MHPHTPTTNPQTHTDVHTNRWRQEGGVGSSTAKSIKLVQNTVNVWIRKLSAGGGEPNSLKQPQNGRFELETESIDFKLMQFQDNDGDNYKTEPELL